MLRLNELFLDGWVELSEALGNQAKWPEIEEARTGALDLDPDSAEALT